MRTQASKLIHASNVYHNEWALQLAALLITLTQQEGGLGYVANSPARSPAPGAKVFFANSGSEANEGAIKVARKVGKSRGPADGSKSEIVCFESSFHGRTLGSLSVTSNAKYQDPFTPLLPGVKVGKVNETAGADLKALVNDKTCAVILEPIQGEGGVNTADVAWVKKLVTRAREVGAVVIFDEIQVSGGSDLCFERFLERCICWARWQSIPCSAPFGRRPIQPVISSKMWLCCWSADALKFSLC